MNKKIYAVAGKRNLKSAEIHGGIFFNLGETKRTIAERLSDVDYSRKAAGGEWEVLGTWNIPDYISDKDIHKVILNSPIISKAAVKKNTEEFFAKTLSRIDLIKEVERYIGSVSSFDTYNHKLETIKSRLRTIKPPKRFSKKRVWDEISGKYKKISKELEDYLTLDLSFSELEILEKKLEKDIEKIKIPNEDEIEDATLSVLMSYAFFESLRETKKNKLKEVSTAMQKRILQEKLDN
jgi:ATP-dependent helicase YprA (DUF1998 family)